jgi:hypothetical protein
MTVFVTARRIARNLAAVCLLPTALASAAQNRPGPLSADLSAQQIVGRAVARAEAQYNSQVDAQFESLVSMSMQSLDSSGQATRTELTEYRQYPLNGALYEELIAKDGSALTERERKEEENNRKKFIREIEKRKKRSLHPQPEKRPGIRFGNRLMQRYRFTMVKSEEVDRRPCWVIAFEPRAGDLPVDEIMDHALNQSTGTLWIAQEDYGLARLTFFMSKPFKYWAGLLAVIRNTEGRLDFQRVESNVWMPSSFDLKLDLNVMLLKDIRRLIKKKWTNYARIGTAAAD